MSKRMELLLKDGVIAFDGDVVEVSGFMHEFSERVPVSGLKRIELRKGRLTFSSMGTIMPLIASLKDEEAESAEVSEFLDAVRAAAPNLEESS